MNEKAINKNGAQRIYDKCAKQVFLLRKFKPLKESKENLLEWVEMPSCPKDELGLV